MSLYRRLPLILLLLPRTPVALGEPTNASIRREQAANWTISAGELEDKIRGGMLGQILGNLNGLPHEFKYIDEPGNVESYVPSLLGGARTDDDTDLEWVIVTEIERSGRLLQPPVRVAELWKTHINRGIWCANRYARDLMELGFEPPLTGSSLVNPWSSFNIAGQFCCESFGLMAPAMPQTAAKIGLHYSHAAVDGEPAQATQLFASMIATAFLEVDVQRILDAGRATVDPQSQVAVIVDVVRAFHSQHPNDWRATRQAIKTRWQVHGGTFRDQNGCELNTASTIAALLYGNGDLVETIRLAFNFGWDCDNNAATAATIVGVTKGREWMNEQGWIIKDIYQNTTRDQMPLDETISRFEDRVIACARLVITEHGGAVRSSGDEESYTIPVQLPRNVEPLPSAAQKERERRELSDRIVQDLSGTPGDCARAVYLALCLDQTDKFKSKHPDEWAAGLAELKKHPAVVRNIFAALPETGTALKQSARHAGLEPPGNP
jgi:ADP-ribosylglycohydrolase